MRKPAKNGPSQLLGSLTCTIPNFEKLHGQPRANLTKLHAVMPCSYEDMMPDLDRIVNV